MSVRNPLAGVNLNLFPILDALFRHRNATAAAKELGVTQSAVSHSLRELRLVLDDPLFVRTGRGLEATPRALAMEATVRTMLESLGNAIEQVPTFEPQSSRRVFTVATADETSATVFPALVARLAQEAPAVRVDVVPRSADAVAMLEHGSADLVLQPERDLGPSVGSEFLYKDSFSCLVRAGHPGIGKRLTLKAFIAHPHVFISTGDHGKSVVDEALATRGLTRRVLVSTRYFMSAPEMVASSDAILTMPTRVAQTVATRLPLRVLQTPFPLDGFSVFCLWNRTRDEPGLTWLRTLLCEVANSSY